jgi:hypothetical protein
VPTILADALPEANLSRSLSGPSQSYGGWSSRPPGKPHSAAKGKGTLPLITLDKWWGVPQLKYVANFQDRTLDRKWHPDFDILRVEFVALIEIVSGSPLN